MTTAGEIWESLHGSIRSRITNPFLGAFILAWCGWNWKALYVTFFVDADELPFKGDVSPLRRHAATRSAHTFAFDDTPATSHGHCYP